MWDFLGFLFPRRWVEHSLYPSSLTLLNWDARSLFSSLSVSWLFCNGFFSSVSYFEIPKILKSEFVVVRGWNKEAFLSIFFRSSIRLAENKDSFTSTLSGEGGSISPYKSFNNTCTLFLYTVVLLWLPLFEDFDFSGDRDVV